MTWVVVGGTVVVIVAVLLVIVRRGRGPDGVTTFQRQIDALSPDARCPSCAACVISTAASPVAAAVSRPAHEPVPPPARHRRCRGDPLSGRPAPATNTNRADGTGERGADLAIDLGTRTRSSMKGRGIVLNEPSVIALNSQTGEVLATGHEAWQMIGRTPGYIVAVRPLRGGAITDFEITERMIRLLLQRVGVSRFSRPKVVICVPSAITEVERRAVTDAARRAGAADANLIEQPMAAAIGADLPIDEPVGNMVIDIGGGTSETAVISLGGVVALEAVRVGSFDVDAAIRTTSAQHGIAIGERTAEEIEDRLGRSDRRRPPGRVRRDLMTGLPDDRAQPRRGALRRRGRCVLAGRLGRALSGQDRPSPRRTSSPAACTSSAVGLAEGVVSASSETRCQCVRRRTARAVVLSATYRHHDAQGMFMGAAGSAALPDRPAAHDPLAGAAIAAGIGAPRRTRRPGPFPPEVLAAAAEAAA